MAGYVIANYDITNQDGYQSYVAAVGPTIAAHGGEILVAGPGSEAVEGDPRPITVVLKFPSKDAARAWYDSPEYQKIVKLRTDNTEGIVVFADEFVMPR
ncbi:MAG: DUF1330 domain-containing protein [Gammaproteobacteria bacterium]|jgi:uncharacterized protein (DUF1330 family)